LLPGTTCFVVVCRFCAGESCETICDDVGKVCDPGEQKGLTEEEMKDLIEGFGLECDDDEAPESTDLRTPYIFTNTSQCRRAAATATSACALGDNPNVNLRRLCCCVLPPAQVENDPHVHTLKGAHYTLLKSGNFLAWSFSKDPVDWHLLAAYSGARLLAVLTRLST
jgi:hypothetical protein